MKTVNAITICRISPIKMALLLLFCFTIIADCNSNGKWELFNLKDSRCSIEFLSPPKYQTIDTPTIFGEAILTIYSSGDNMRAYFLSYFDIPKDCPFPINSIIDQEIAKGTKGIGNSIVSDTPFKAEHYEGRDVIADHPSGKLRLRVRYIAKGSRLFMLTVTGPNDNVTEEGWSHFISHLELLEFSLPIQGISGVLRQPGLFSYQMPAGWKEMSLPRISNPIAFDVLNKDSGVYIQVDGITTSSTFEDYIINNKKSLKNMCPESEIIDERPFVTKSGLTGVRMVVKNINQQPIYYAFEGRDKVKFMVMAHCTTSSFEKYAPILDETMKTFVSE